MRTRRPAPVLVIAVLATAGGCAGPPLPSGIAAARALGAGDGAEGPDADAPAGPLAPPGPEHEVDPLLDFSRALARVNGEAIVLRQVRLEVGPEWEHLLDRRADLERLKEARLRDLVLRRLLVSEAKRIGLDVPEGAMEKAELDERRLAESRGTTLDQHARDYGTTRREMRENLREKILEYQARAYFTGQFPGNQYHEDFFRPSVDFFVSPAEIRAWPEKHPTSVEVPASARLRILDLRTDEFRGEGVTDAEARERCRAAAEAARARALAGEPFAELVRELSHGPDREEGGLLPPMRSGGKERREFREWAFAPGRTPGEVSEPILHPHGALLLFLEEREDGGVRPIAEWGAVAGAALAEAKRQAAWSEVRIRLVEDATVEEGPGEPRGLRDRILGWLDQQRRDALAVVPRPPGAAIRASLRATR